ncbi:conserved Plasmodium protein, unknown function [Plasmodium gallinaceum]|uniref:Uncharacterized protein n=1 Tax=Plasmodium gallinaceum TaxID=5849 RepID=A0A1J1GS56_PLAGA|nr:conserved Plasmodium protein, unknown function [Plasmodium gallinaceum]CRG95311.1 conserved Plasmodium protein, unknown function [Plasmodium gallinaceum]
MSEYIASFLANFELLICHTNCCSKQKFKFKNYNFCGFDILLNNKSEKVLNKTNKVNNFINIYKSKKGYNVSKYYMDGCIKKKDVIFNLEGSNLNENNNCNIFMNNRDNDELNTVIDLDNEILIGNFQFDYCNGYDKPLSNNEEHFINCNKNNLEIHKMDKNTGKAIERLKSNINDIYKTPINNRSLNTKKNTDQIYNFVISKKNTKKTNTILNDKFTNDKENIFSNSTISTKNKPPLSHPDSSYKDIASDTSSEFFSVISNIKPHMRFEND